MGFFGDIQTNVELLPGQVLGCKLDDTGFQSFPLPAGLNYGQSSVSRALNSVFVPSTTKNALVSYSVDIAATLSLTTGQSGTVFLEISADGSTNWVELNRFTNGNSGSLTIGLNLTQTNTGTVSGSVPLGYSVRLRTANGTGTPTFTYRSGQETTL